MTTIDRDDGAGDIGGVREEHGDAQAWRAGLLATILRFVLVLGIATAVPSIAFAISESEYAIAVVDLVAIVVVGILVRSDRLSYPQRAVGLLGIAYLLGVWFLYRVGLVSEIYLLAVPILAALLLGRRAALVLLAISSVTLGVAGYLVDADVGRDRLELDLLGRWVIISLNFAFVGAVVSVSAAALLRRLEGSVERQRAIAARLEEGRADLQRVNDELATEVVERRRAEDETRRLAMAIEQAREVVVIGDIDGRIIYTNGAFDELVSRVGDAARVPHVQDFTPAPADRRGGPEGEQASEQVSLVAAVEQHRMWTGTIVVQASGEEHLLETVVTPLRDGAGAVVNVVATMRDVTTERQMAARLRRSEKLEALGTLASGTAHDFNNIIGSILAVAEFTLDDVRGTALEPNLASIVTACSRARDIVRQMMVFGQQPAAVRVPTSIVRVVEQALPLLRAATPSNIDIRAELSEGGLVLAEDGEIHQVLMNLATNGVHAMSRMGTGTLTVEVRDGRTGRRPSEPEPSFASGASLTPYTTMLVRDTGHGIDPAVIDRIFDPFFTTKQTSEGSGLGLASVHGIVHSLGGEVHVDSRTDVGTTFRVWIPAVAGTAGERIVSAEDVRTGVGVILLVDDEATIRDLTTTYLGGLGYRVLPQHDGRAARQVFDADPWAVDLVVTDLTMPEFSGADLLRHVHSVRPDLPVVLTSGFPRASGDGGLDDLGLSAFLQKPYTLRDLANAVHAALAGGGRGQTTIGSP